MRLPVSPIILLFIAAALFGENLAAAAQSANPYPWCGIYYKEGGGTPRCYFDTRDQCMASISGIGGFCVQNLQYSPSGEAERAQAQELSRGKACGG